MSGLVSVVMGLLSLLLPAQSAVQNPLGAPQPPRDAASRPAAAAGTASISGRVTTMDGRPLKRAQIRVALQGVSPPLTASTNSDGVYQLRDVPSGRLTVMVTRSGYLPIQLGQRRPGELARPLQVAEGETIERLDFVLPKSSSIGGVISDENNEPVAGARVYVMQWEYFRGRRRLVPAGGPGASTDDTGHYRIGSLMPGDYFVMAMLRETWTTTRSGEKVVLSYSPSYYPGTARQSEAQRVTLALGQDLSAVDVALVPGRAARLSGTVTGADGTPLAGAEVSVSQEIVGPTTSSFSSVGGTKTAADGTWTLRDVPPGEFRLSATHRHPEGGSLEAAMTIQVGGADQDGIVLTTLVPGHITGHVASDTGEVPPSSFGRVNVVAESLMVDARASAAAGDRGAVGADGRFTIRNVTGPVLLRVYGLAPGWAVRSIMAGERDYTLAPLDIGGGRTVENVRITVTKSFPDVTGRIVNDKGEPVEGTVLLFPAEPSAWLEPAAAERAARPDQSGTFRFPTVRPGAYLAIALDYVGERQAADPEFLAGLRKRATAVTVTEGAVPPLTLEVQR